MSDQTPAGPVPTEAPVDPVVTHAASPFIRTETPTPVAFASPPDARLTIMPGVAWAAYKMPIYIGTSILAYLMVLVGSVTAVQANPVASWKYEVAVLPVIPGSIVVALMVRQLGRMDEVQKRTQLQALGFSMAGTALLTFSYGFLEGVGLPDLNLTLVLPVAAVLWALALAGFAVRYRLRR